MLLISSPRFQEHTTPPGHPERPERAEVFDRVAAAWRDEGGAVVEPRAATRAELLRVHDEAHVAAMEAANGRAVMLDPDNRVLLFELVVKSGGGGVVREAGVEPTTFGFGD